MRRRRRRRSSGIGGQAVLEGIMMKNKDKYAVAVRKPDGKIEVEVNTYHSIVHDSILLKIPFVRGIFNFIDSMILGMKSLNYSAEFYEDEDAKETVADKAFNKLFKDGAEKVFAGLVTVFAILIAIAVFMVLPWYLTSLLEGYVRNDSLSAIIEGVIRILIFIMYVLGISLMKDIRRLYRYHGAEHKCINCIEKGRPLTVHNVMRSSKRHKRCGTSFMLLVMLISIVLFFFIRVDNPIYKVLLRIALIPVIAGISYEIIRLAGRSNNILVSIISAPGMLLQGLTTREPDESMAEVAIAAVEAVFDWKEYLYDTFGYEVDDSWLVDEDTAQEDYEREYEADSEYREETEYEGDYEYGEEPEYEEDYEYEGESEYETESEYEVESEYETESEYKVESESDIESESETETEGEDAQNTDNAGESEDEVVQNTDEADGPEDEDGRETESESMEETNKTVNAEPRKEDVAKEGDSQKNVSKSVNRTNRNKRKKNKRKKRNTK